MTGLLAQFIVLAGVIVVAGTYLAKSADLLGERTGMGRSMAGLVFLAIATSLPELTVDCSAAMIPAPDLAVGDILGSCLFNLLILAVLDLATTTRGRMLSRSAAAHALSATASILLTAFTLLFLLVDFPWPFHALGPGSIVIVITYALCVRLIYFDQQFEHGDTTPEVSAGETPLRRILATYVAATLVIFAAAPWLARTADQLAQLTGLGGTFVGTTLVALSTSLPEASTTRAAIRMNAPDLAIGNILGSNSFNIVILFAVDLFYDGPLLASVSETHAITAVAVVLVTAVATMGMLYRAEKRLWLIEPDAFVVILFVVGALWLVYRAEG